MPQDDSSVITQFSTPPGSPQNNTATPGETITLSDQWAVSLDQNTQTGDIILQDTLNGVIPASDVTVNNGGTYYNGIITWDLKSFSGLGTKNGKVSFGDYTATITVPLDYAQDSITSLATITPAPGDIDASNNTSMASIDIICYCSGTLIKTPFGSVAVERLSVGDRVVTVSGGERSIRWLAYRRIDCHRYPSPADAWPIRVAAHAFGPDLPARDLQLSPGHPILVGADAEGEGGHLVPVMCLINGTTIERLPIDEVTYWHIELDQHDILLAEGLPAESYIDLGSRPWFAGADGALYDPDMALPGLPGRCRPVAVDGPVVEAERRRLDEVFAMRLASASKWPDMQSALLALF